MTINKFLPTLAGMALLLGGHCAVAQQLDARLPVLAKKSGLEAALTAAVTRHPALAGKAAAVEAKDYAGDAARAQRYPSLSAQAQQIANQGNAAGRPSNNPANVRARQALWAFGRIDSSIAYSDADTAAERSDYLRLQRQLIDNTVASYAKVYSLTQRQKALLDNVAAHQSFHEQIQRRERGQLASGADVRLAASRLIQARAQKERVDGDLDVAQAELLALTQIPVSAEVPVAGTSLVLPAASELEAIALAQSADALYKGQLIARAEAGVDQAQTAAMPTLYLQADKYFNQPVYQNDSQLSVVLEGNLDGMGWGAFSRARAARAQLSAAQEDLRSTQVDIRRTVKSLDASRRMQHELIAAQVDSVRELTALLESYKRQYVAGTKSWLDVLNLLRELSEQRLQQVQAEGDWLNASLRLTALIGGFDALLGIAKESAKE